MQNWLTYLQKHSKTFLNISIIFLSMTIIMYLVISKEKEQEGPSYLKLKVDQTLDKWGEQFKGVGSLFIPFSSTAKSIGSEPLPWKQSRSEMDSIPETQSDTSIEWSIILADKRLYDTLLKGLLAILISYLLVNYAIKSKL